MEHSSLRLGFSRISKLLGKLPGYVVGVDDNFNRTVKDFGDFDRTLGKRL